MPGLSRPDMIASMASEPALLLGSRVILRRLDVVPAGFRIEEFSRGGQRLGGGILVFLPGGDVLAAVDALGLIGAACNGDADATSTSGCTAMAILCLPMLLIGASSITWLRLMATPSLSNDAIISRIDTDPNNCPDSDA
jgi:hypothetical protein